MLEALRQPDLKTHHQAVIIKIAWEWLKNVYTDHWNIIENSHTDL